jgi:hypothetical protein
MGIEKSIHRATGCGLDGKSRLHFSPIDREQHDQIFVPPSRQSCENCINEPGARECKGCNPNDAGRVLGPRNWKSKERIS